MIQHHTKKSYEHIDFRYQIKKRNSKPVEFKKCEICGKTFHPNELRKPHGVRACKSCLIENSEKLIEMEKAYYRRVAKGRKQIPWVKLSDIEGSKNQGAGT